MLLVCLLYTSCPFHLQVFWKESPAFGNWSLHCCCICSLIAIKCNCIIIIIIIIIIVIMITMKIGNGSKPTMISIPALICFGLPTPHPFVQPNSAIMRCSSMFNVCQCQHHFCNDHWETCDTYFGWVGPHKNVYFPPISQLFTPLRCLDSNKNPLN